MNKIILIWMLIILSIFSVQAQDYEVWGTVKITNKLSDKFTLSIEVEDRYNFTQHNIRYFHYDLGSIYELNDSWSIGGFYREIYVNKEDFNTKVTVLHGDIFHKWEDFKFRARLEYIIFNEDIDLNNQFRLRLQPTWQSVFWNNFNPFIQTEFFIKENKHEFTRNRFNIGLTIKTVVLEIQPGYILESNLKNSVWSNKNIFWLNTKFKF